MKEEEINETECSTEECAPEVCAEPVEEPKLEGSIPEQEDTGDWDYERQASEDLKELCREFPEIEGIKSLTEIKNPLRYAALRDLGLTPTEAYLAARGKPVYDNRGHLAASVPRAAGTPRGFMPSGELNAARAIFRGMPDSEIQKLYQKVTK